MTEVTWEDCYQRGDGNLRYPDEVIVQTIHHLELPPSKALVVGSGSGRHVRMLIDKGFQPYGVDGSYTARRTAIAHGVPKGLLTTEQFPPLRYPDDDFGLVLAVNVLEHNLWADRQSLLREIYRVLSPGGCFISRHVKDTGYMPQNATKKLETNTYERKNDTFVHYFTRQEILVDWEDAGFSIVQLGTLDAEYKWMPWLYDNQFYVVAYKSNEST